MRMKPIASKLRQRGFLLNPFRFGSVGGGGGSGGSEDPYWSNVVSLLHMNGANLSNTFTDVKGIAWTTIQAKISTAQSKFGGSSGVFDGSWDRVDSASNAGFAFGTGDFTVEMWVWPSSAGSGYLYFYGNDYTISSDWVVYGFDCASSKFFVQANAFTTQWSQVCAKDQWHLVEVNRASGRLRFFVDGFLTNPDVALPHNLTTQQAYVGGASTSLVTSDHFMMGHIDEVRITKGVARNLVTYTPPTSAFPES